MKGRDVLAQKLGGVALRIEGDKKHLHLRAVGTQLSQGRSKIGERRGTNIGTIGEAEGDYCDLAAKIRKGARLPGGIRQVQPLAHPDPVTSTS